MGRNALNPLSQTMNYQDVLSLLKPPSIDMNYNKNRLEDVLQNQSAMKQSLEFYANRQSQDQIQMRQYGEQLRSELQSEIKNSMANLQSQLSGLSISEDNLPRKKNRYDNLFS